MIRNQTEELYAEKLEETEKVERAVEPNHDDEPILEYPKMATLFVLPPKAPSKFEEDSLIFLDEPLVDPTQKEGQPTQTEPASHFLTHDQVQRTHEMSVQCDNPEEESKEPLDTI